MCGVVVLDVHCRHRQQEDTAGIVSGYETASNEKGKRDQGTIRQEMWRNLRSLLTDKTGGMKVVTAAGSQKLLAGRAARLGGPRPPPDELLYQVICCCCRITH
jgi:hypothetical protein